MRRKRQEEVEREEEVDEELQEEKVNIPIIRLTVANIC